MAPAANPLIDPRRPRRVLARPADAARGRAPRAPGADRLVRRAAARLPPPARDPARRRHGARARHRRARSATWTARRARCATPRCSTPPRATRWSSTTSTADAGYHPGCPTIGAALAARAVARRDLGRAAARDRRRLRGLLPHRRGGAAEPLPLLAHHRHRRHLRRRHRRPRCCSAATPGAPRTRSPPPPPSPAACSRPSAPPA